MRLGVSNAVAVGNRSAADIQSVSMGNAENRISWPPGRIFTRIQL